MGPNRILLCVLSIFLSFPLFASPEFIWPLQQNYGISATFGEPREDHFHAGIDLSTNGETGLPVLAVADGFIYRLKIQKRAYGRALYIRHANGTQSLYAHLQAYSNELGLQKLYLDKAEQMKTPYVGDIFIEPGIPVKQGQVVAYSGESGAGLPHLHFELRKNEDVAINPLLNGLQDTLDPIPPTFQACYFYPLNSDSAINGELETKEVRFRKIESKFVPDSIPIVRGEFRISVSAYDSALRPYHRAPGKISYSIDDREIFSVDFDRVSYTQPNGFGLFYDLGKPGPSFYEYPVMMAKLVDFPLPFINKSVPFATQNLTPGNHRLRIQASDSNNNVSFAEVPFIVNRPPSLNLDSVQSDDADLIVNATLTDANNRGPGSVSGQVEYSIDEGKSFLPFVRTSLNLGSGGNSYEYRVASKAFRNVRSVLIRARAFDGVEYSPFEVARLRAPAMTVETPVRPIPSGDLRFEAYRNTIHVIYETQGPVPGKLQVTIGDPPVFFPLMAREITSRVASIPVPKETGTLDVALQGAKSLTVPVYFASAGKAAQIARDNFQLSLQENSLYFDTFVWTKSLPKYRSRSLPLIGPMLQLGPRGLPLDKGGNLDFQYPDTVTHPERLSVYRWDRAAQRWKSLPSQVNRSAKTVQARISYFDLFALIYDNMPPGITPIFPKRGSVTRNDTPVLAASIRDLGMDVDDEKVTFFVDGEPYQAEYDPDRNTASAKITNPLRKGYHKFSVLAFDYGGNRSQSSTITFRVK